MLGFFKAGHVFNSLHDGFVGGDLADGVLETGGCMHDKEFVDVLFEGDVFGAFEFSFQKFEEVFSVETWTSEDKHVDELEVIFRENQVEDCLVEFLGLFRVFGHKCFLL